MQGEADKYIKVISAPKHYALNSSENNRHKGSSYADEATIREYYAKVFEYVVREGKAQSIMTSYNRINGVPAFCNDMLLTTLLREEWGFDGFVVSDCAAVGDTYTNPVSNYGGSGHYYDKLVQTKPLHLRKMTVKHLNCHITKMRKFRSYWKLIQIPL